MTDHYNTDILAMSVFLKDVKILSVFLHSLDVKILTTTILIFLPCQYF